MALHEDVPLFVTYNSIAAVEALMEGKPALVLGQNVIPQFAKLKLQILNIQTTSRDEIEAFCISGYCPI